MYFRGMSHSMGLCGKRFEAFEVRGTVVGLSFFTAYQFLPRDNLTYIASEQSSVICDCCRPHERSTSL
jgi:hypothetical protein